MRHKPPKKRECRTCHEEFQPRNSLQHVCSTPCAILEIKRKKDAKAKAQSKKVATAQRVSVMVRKNALKTNGQWVKEAQASFNRYVRMRDKGKPCISCNRHVSDINTLRGHNIDCGHYRSRGSAGHLRFNLYNAHGQCVQCNRDLSGNVVDYRICLIRRIGQDRVDRLECDNSIRKFDIEYLKRIKRIFNKKARLAIARHMDL